MNNLEFECANIINFQPYIDKLKSLKKAMKDLEFRVKEKKERPEALAALDSMLNHSSIFLVSLKNLSSLDINEDKMFTEVEIETLEKLINETEVCIYNFVSPL